MTSLHSESTKKAIKRSKVLAVMDPKYPLNNSGEEVLLSLTRDKNLRDTIMKWMMLEDHHLKFQKCNDGISDDCINVGLRKLFHGKKCPACERYYRRELYARKNPIVPTKKPRMVKFKKGTKSKDA